MLRQVGVPVPDRPRTIFAMNITTAAISSRWIRKLETLNTRNDTNHTSSSKTANPTMIASGFCGPESYTAATRSSGEPGRCCAQAAVCQNRRVKRRAVEANSTAMIETNTMGTRLSISLPATICWPSSITAPTP